MKPSQSDTTALIISAVLNVTQSWNIDISISPETTLIDELGFSSMEFIELLGNLETQMQRKLPYEKLLITEGGEYRKELTIYELSTFICDQYDNERPNSGAA